MYVYTLQQKDYDDYPIGGVMGTVGPFDSWDEAYAHAQKHNRRYYANIQRLTPPTT